MTTQSVPPRSAIAPEHTWDALNVFSSDEGWESAITHLEACLGEVARFQSHLGDGSAVLADWFDYYEQIKRGVNKIYLYATLRYDVDTTDASTMVMIDRARALRGRVTALTAFAEPELLAVGDATLRRWVAEEPRLAHFGYHFERLERRRAHVRSAEVEEVIGMTRSPFDTASVTHRILNDADMRFRPAHTGDGVEIEVAHGNIHALLTHADRAVRQSAWESYADAGLALRHTAANCLTAGVQQRVFLARARRYGSTLEAALDDECIPVEIFHNLIATFRRHLPIWHRYWRLRRQTLGYEQLHVYDIKAPLNHSTPHVPFVQAIDWIAEGMRPLGDTYVAALRRGVQEQRWVDVYPNQGKRAGAYSTGTPGHHPFILMSYADDIFSLSTLAHELGHSLHSLLTWQTQPYIYANYSLFVAEVASNFNQAMVRAYLLDQSDDPEFQIAVIEEAMSNFHRYFFLMPTLARFELAIHEQVERGDGLTAAGLNALMTTLFREGYGDEVVIDEERIGITWAQFPLHLYANFYTYEYATGIAGAHALAAAILAGESGAVERYLAFLKAGSSRSPLDALRLAGVDLASSEPIERTFGILEQLIDRLEQALARRAR